MTNFFAHPKWQSLCFEVIPRMFGIRSKFADVWGGAAFVLELCDEEVTLSRWGRRSLKSWSGDSSLFTKTYGYSISKSWKKLLYDRYQIQIFLVFTCINILMLMFILNLFAHVCGRHLNVELYIFFWVNRKYLSQPISRYPVGTGS